MRETSTVSPSYAGDDPRRKPAPRARRGRSRGSGASGRCAPRPVPGEHHRFIDAEMRRMRRHQRALRTSTSRPCTIAARSAVPTSFTSVRYASLPEAIPEDPGGRLREGERQHPGSPRSTVATPGSSGCGSRCGLEVPSKARTSSIEDVAEPLPERAQGLGRTVDRQAAPWRGSRKTRRSSMPSCGRRVRGCRARRRRGSIPARAAEAGAPAGCRSAGRGHCPRPRLRSGCAGRADPPSDTPRTHSRSAARRTTCRCRGR